MECIGSKPTGFKGIFAGVIMNMIHAKQYKKIICNHIANNIDTTSPLNILDIGCGGGKAISIFCSLFKSSKIIGIDHSPDMVALSKKVNKQSIQNGQIEILQGYANDLPFSNGFFDIITAFDTINFWDNFDHSINEIKKPCNLILLQGLLRNKLRQVINFYVVCGGAVFYFLWSLYFVC